MMKKTLLTTMTAVLAAGMAFMVSCGTKSEKPEEFPVETPVEEMETPIEAVETPVGTEVETPVEETPGTEEESEKEETSPSATKPETKPAPTPTPAPKPVVTTKTETKTESIPLQTVRQNDATLEKGKEVVAQNGVNGTKSVS